MINISLLEVIKKVLAYAKFLKDVCIVKRHYNFQKKANPTKQVSALF